jgi:hypothetical protein
MHFYWWGEDRMTNSLRKEEEGLKSFSRFLVLFDKAAPIIRYIANLEDLRHGEIPVSPYMLLESNLTLKMILQALRKMPESKDKDFSILQKEFDTALSNCIRAAEATEKYVAMGRGERAKFLLTVIINSSVMAHEYVNSLSGKIELYSKKIHLEESISRFVQEEKKEAPPSSPKPAISPKNQPQPLPVKDFLKEKEKTNHKIKIEKKNEYKPPKPPANPQGLVNNAADAIEHGLDKIGDALIAPFDLIDKAIKKSRGKRR